MFEKEARPVLEAAGATLDIRVTGSAGDGARWARDADIDCYDGILACGGDGTLHEVLRGITTRPDCSRACAKLALGHLPGGSGNAVAHNVSCVSNERSDMVAGAYLAVKGVPHAVDVALTWDQTGKIMPAMLMVEWGLISDIDFESEWLRVLGSARFTVTAVQRILGLRHYPVTLELLPSRGATADPQEFYRLCAASADAGVAPKSELLGSKQSEWERVAGDRAVCVACNMPWVDRSTPIAPSARLDDGAFTVVTSSDGLGRLALAREFLRLDAGGHLDTGLLTAQSAVAIRLVPQAGSVSAIGVDGEVVVEADVPKASLDAVLYPGVVNLYMAAVPEPPRSKL